MKYCKISNDKRQLICQLLDTQQMTRSEVSDFLNIPYRTVCNIFHRFSDTGEVPERKKPIGRPKKRSDEDSRIIEEWLAENCTLTLMEIKKRFQDEKGIEISLATIHRYLQKFNFSVNRLKLVVTRSTTEELWQERVQFSNWFLQSEYQNGKVIFLDETGFKVTMHRGKSRARRGEDARKEVAAIQSRNITVLASVNYSCLTHYKIIRHWEWGSLRSVLDRIA